MKNMPFAVNNYFAARIVLAIFKWPLCKKGFLYTELIRTFRSITDRMEYFGDTIVSVITSKWIL